jgi:hypothetical protein
VRKGFLRTICLGIATFLVFLLAFTAEAGEHGDILKLRSLNIKYNNYFDGSRHPIVTSQPKEALSINLDTDFLEYFFFNNKVHAVTDNGQYRLVGWNSLIGFRPFESLDVFYEHHSQHLLDTQGERKFPSEDSWGITIHIFREKHRPESMF